MAEYSNNSTPSLPTEMLFEVFSRLPVKTLSRICCVSKFWKDLIISDQNFIRYHLQQSMKKTSRNVLMYSSRSPFRGLPDPADQRFNKADDNCLLKPFFLGPGLLLVGCINGIFCFDEYNALRNIYLWNPALHQCRVIPLGINWFNVVSFLYEPTNDEYILVGIHTHSSGVDVYNLSSNFRKKLTFTCRPSASEVGIKDRVAIVHNEVVHWLSYRRRPENMGLFLNVFDLHKEKFQEIKLSDLIPFEPYNANIGLLKECLCIFGRTTDDKYGLWMMKEYGIENSIWTKQFEFPSHIVPQRFLSGVRTNGKFVAEREGCLVLYDPESEQTETIQDEPILYDENMKYFLTDNYVESLVWVLPQDRTKTKPIEGSWVISLDKALAWYERVRIH